jgi:signal transduction histidine kinase
MQERRRSGSFSAVRHGPATSLELLGQAAIDVRAENVAQRIVDLLVESFGASFAVIYGTDADQLVPVAMSPLTASLAEPGTIAKAVKPTATPASGVFPRAPVSGPALKRAADPGEWRGTLMAGPRHVGEVRARFAGHAPHGQRRSELDTCLAIAGVLYARALDSEEPNALGRKVAETALRAMHDLRQPLNAMSLNAELIAHADPGQSRAVNALRGGVRRMERAMDDFHDAALVELGGLALRLGPVDLVQLVERVLASGTPPPPLEVSSGGDLHHVSVDSGRIERTLHALLAFAGARGTVSVHMGVAANGTDACISVLCAGVYADAPDDPRMRLSRAILAAHGGHVAHELCADGTTALRVVFPVGAGTHAAA